jgi:hypothetical protein
MLNSLCQAPFIDQRTPVWYELARSISIAKLTVTNKANKCYQMHGGKEDSQSKEAGR